MDKDKLIESIYTDPAGFGSITDTFKQARKIDKNIRREDVKLWFDKNIHRKTNLSGYNSFIAPSANYEYQIDLFFMTGLKEEIQHKFKLAMCCIDIFTKFLTVVPLKSKSEGDFLAGVMECINNLGSKPIIIYSDNEGSWNGKYMQQYLKENNIKLITTLSHAFVVERAIRTIKDMLYKRLENDAENPWYGEMLQQVIFIYNFGKVHSTIEMTPNDARKLQNEDKVKSNLYKHSNYSRTYPDVKVNDLVRVYQKKDKLDKQQTSLWTKQRYKVESITEENNQIFYKTSWNNGKLLLRHEILLVPN